MREARGISTDMRRRAIASAFACSAAACSIFSTLAVTSASTTARFARTPPEAGGARVRKTIFLSRAPPASMAPPAAPAALPAAALPAIASIDGPLALPVSDCLAASVLRAARAALNFWRLAASLANSSRPSPPFLARSYFLIRALTSCTSRRMPSSVSAKRSSWASSEPLLSKSYLRNRARAASAVDDGALLVGSKEPATMPGDGIFDGAGKAEARCAGSVAPLGLLSSAAGAPPAIERRRAARAERPWRRATRAAAVGRRAGSMCAQSRTRSTTCCDIRSAGEKPSAGESSPEATRSIVMCAEGCGGGGGGGSPSAAAGGGTGAYRRRSVPRRVMMQPIDQMSTAGVKPSRRRSSGARYHWRGSPEPVSSAVTSQSSSRSICIVIISRVRP